MADEQEVRAQTLLKLYDEGVRPFLEEQNAPDLDALDRAKGLVIDALRPAADLRIGFLGESQVGKSSVINALLDERVLPSGGTGPLTAQATHVSYRDTNAFEVRYHDRARVEELVNRIHGYLTLRGELGAGTKKEAEAVGKRGGERESADPSENEETETGSEVLENLLRSVRLMLKQDNVPDPADLPRTGLLDAMRLVLSQKRHADAELLKPWLPAIEAIRRKLDESETIEESEAEPRAFKVQLRLRAAGWMSPLVKTLQVHYRKELLNGLTIVDLPGINNFGDPGGEFATPFIRSRDAGALAVVVRNNLVSNAVSALMHDVVENYGVLEKSLWRSDKPPLELIFLVTSADNVARGKWAERNAEALELDMPSPSEDEVFESVANEIEQRLREQFREVLASRKADEDGSEAKRQQVGKVIDELADRVRVICPVAPDYQALQEGRGVSFLRTKEATNIPKLRDFLRQLAADHAATRRRSLESSVQEMEALLKLQLRSVIRAYQDGGGRSSTAHDRFRSELEKKQVELSKDVVRGHVEVAKKLQAEVDSSIDTLLREAGSSGLRRLVKLSHEANKMYWSSLNAALTHHGEWKTRSGSTINYPQSLTRAISQEIASSWDSTVIDSVRRAMRMAIARDLEQVEALCRRAEELDSKLVSPELVEEQRQILKSAMVTAVRWTKELLDSLTADVEQELPQHVLPPIVKACDAARRAGENRGTGAKAKIIEAFRRGGEAAIGQAVEGTREVLRKHSRKVLKDIRQDYFKEGHDPVRSAFEALCQDEHSRARRSDGQRRAAVLARAESLLASLLVAATHDEVAA